MATMQSWKYVGLLSLLGCGGGGSQVEVPTKQISPNCSIFITWTPSISRIDGSAFTIEDVQYYDLFIGMESGAYYRQVRINDGYLTAWEEFKLKGGTNYFAMTVTDNGNLESDKTNELVRFFDNRCTGE